MGALERAREALAVRLETSATPGALPSGPSVAYVLGAVVTSLVLLLAATGAALSFYYSPSATDAWASVAFVEDELPWGSLVRGLHLHGASALVIACGLHLTQAVWLGGYRRPRELTWYAGLVLLLLVLASSVTGLVLRWDQAGYWASKVEIGIAAATPVIGDVLQRLAQGGNDYGNLTVTRFHALHVVVLPALLMALVAGHLWLARRHGPVPRAAKLEPSRRWPAQTVRDLLAVAAVFAALTAVVLTTGGAGLEAPADPSSTYDARPLWFFRWLFHLRKLAGAWEAAAALLVPGLVLGFLAAMPFLAQHAEAAKAQARHRLLRAGFLALCAGITALTALSWRADAHSEERQKHLEEATVAAAKARRLAKTYGVPAAGASALAQTVPMWRGRTLWERHCKSCHQGAEREGPLIEAGYGSRAWIARLFADPGGDELFGRTKIAKGEGAMEPVALQGPALAAMIELVYAESGAADADRELAARALPDFEDKCSDCHSREDGVASSGPALARRGSVESLVHFMGNPKAAIHFGDASEMPRFDRELSMADREELAKYLVWLRSATPAMVNALEPL